MSSEGIAPQFTGTNGPSARAPLSWISRATSSLPVPDSPVMCTGAWLRATRRDQLAQRVHGRASGPCSREPAAGSAAARSRP